jgi:hypothetical protein
MDRSPQIVDEHPPGDLRNCLVGTRLRRFLVVGSMCRYAGTGVGLAHKDLNEMDPLAPPSVKLFERLDRADCDRSGKGAESKQDRLVAQLAEADPITLGVFER